MTRIVALHARTTGLHFETGALRFGPQWQTRIAPGDGLEFSEYGRDHHGPGWLLFTIAVGALLWLLLAVVIF